MKKRIAGIIGALALVLTGAASVGCLLFLMDEPKAVNKLID